MLLSLTSSLAKVEQILVTFPGITQQPQESLHSYKSSWFLIQATPEILDMLRKQSLEAGLLVTLVYSGFARCRLSWVIETCAGQSFW